MGISQVENGLKFLMKIFFVNEFKDGALNVYSLNKMRKSKEDLREMNRKQYLKHRKKILNKQNEYYRKKKKRGN